MSNRKPLVITKDERTTPDGFVVAVPTLLNVLKYRLANPLASHALIGEMIGMSRETVSRAISTPYGRNTLDQIPLDTMDLYAGKLQEAQGDTVQYYHSSVVTGLKALGHKRPDAAVLANARGAGDSISRITGLLRDGVSINVDTRDALDYSDALEIDATVIDALEQGEGEVTQTPGPRVEENPTTPDPKTDE